MKILCVSCKNFKNCADDFTIDLVAKSKKTEEDKTYELQETAPNLYTFNTVAFIGKNASGKSSALSLLEYCYSILETFRINNRENIHFENTKLEIIFYHEDFIYKYNTTLNTDPRSASGRDTLFTDQHIYKKKYRSTKIKTLFDFSDTDEEIIDLELPEDTSKLFFILKHKKVYSIIHTESNDLSIEHSVSYAFYIMNSLKLSEEIFRAVLSIFDSNIKELRKTDEHHYEIIYNDKKLIKSDTELFYFLSSGTIKGISVYMSMIVSLLFGMDLVIDEIENHFHKTLVEKIISLYKDPDINKKHATLLMTTHYCEILDLFNRQDNIWITKSNQKVYIENMYEKYALRNDSIKSKHFYNNTFRTAVNYDALMELKKILKSNGKSGTID